MKRNLKVTLISLLFAVKAMAQPCIGTQTLVANPQPNGNGSYFSGTVVTFCYTVTDYAQSGVDWLCGIVPTLGPGWDPTTLTPVQTAPSCDGIGEWDWYTSCTSTNSGITFGPGFYYDTPSGSPNGTLDGIPGNNYGDNCQTNTWTFCFSVQVKDCASAPDGTDLTMTLNAYPDNIAGSWGTAGCVDPPVSLPAHVFCNCTLIVPTVVTTDASCANTADGSITVTPQGIPPYTFLWSNGATTQNLTNIPPGIYTITVTDSTLCDKTVIIPVGGPQPIVLNPTVIPDGCSGTGGSIALNVSGGTGTTYTYNWSNGQTTASLSNLTGGTYTVTVTDANNCTETGTYTITSAVPITIATSSTPTTCSGSNGTASVTVTGGTAPFTYLWAPSGGTGPTESNLAPGVYTVTVTDAAGCIVTSQVTVQAIGAFTLTSAYVPLGCTPGATTSATVSVNGGVGPFTYSWSPSGGSDSTATGLTAGTYTVLVTDANSCTSTSTVVIPPVIPISLTTTGTPVMCNSTNTGSASVTATGGTGIYTYVWSDGSTTSSLNGIAAGTYTVTVSDNSGCVQTTTVVVGTIPDVFADAGQNVSVCNGQPATLNGSASGGTGPFSYSWNNGPTSQSQTVNPTATTTYILTVVDANSCTATANVTVNVVDYPVVSITPNTNICYGTSVTLTAGGGSTYSWSPTTGLNDPNVASPVATPLTTTTYSVSVTNSLCTSTGTVTIDVAPQVDASFAPDTTQGEAPLTVVFSNNSSGAANYNWTFGDGSGSQDPDPTHTFTDQGSYTVTLVATNSLGCTDTAKYNYIIVNEYAALTVPNVFTPNGDGKNDTFSFIEKGIESISVVILNRWGNEISSWEKKNGSWDGKISGGADAPEGVYFYIIKARGIDDKPYNYQGTVQLIRNK